MVRVLREATAAALGMASALVWVAPAHADRTITKCSEGSLKAAISAGGTVSFPDANF